MKYQHYTLGLALAALVCSCNNEEILETKASFSIEDLIVNLNVENPQDITDTRAIKTGWAENDRLYMWFDGRPNNGQNPDLVLEYHLKINGNDDKWEPVSDVSLSGNAPQAAGKVWAYYESHNTGTVFSYETATVPAHDEYTEPYTISAIPMVAFACHQDYTYSDNTITATLHWYTRNDYENEMKSYGGEDGWSSYPWENLPDNSAAKWLSGVGYTNIQVVIHGMNASEKARKWALKCPQFNNIMSVYPGWWSTGLNRYTLNVPNADGPAFYFKNDSREYGNWDYEFMLMDITDPENPVYYKYIAENKTWDSRFDYFRGIKLVFEKFTQVVNP